MIYLTEEQFIGCGKLRASYQHPADRGRIIKVPAEKKRKSEQANSKELKNYHSLMLKHTDLNCISHCYGFVSTNLGRGLVCECIRDDDGSVSKSLWEIIIYQKECDLDSLMIPVEQLCTTLMEQKILLFDLNLKNITMRQGRDGRYESIITDLKGVYDNSELIPLSNYIEFLGRRKLKRRCTQLLERIPDFRRRRVELQTAVL